MLHRTEDACAFLDERAPGLSRALGLHLGLMLAARVAHGARREELAQLAGERFRLARPAFLHALAEVSAAELAARLFLDAPECFMRAHAPLLVGCHGALSLRRADYIADVVPSRDRLAGIARWLEGRFHALGFAVVHCAHFSDDHQLSIFARGEGERPLQVGLCFFFESGALFVRAPLGFDHARLRGAFGRIFARDSDYFGDAQASAGHGFRAEASAQVPARSPFDMRAEADEAIVSA